MGGLRSPLVDAVVMQDPEQWLTSRLPATRCGDEAVPVHDDRATDPRVEEVIGGRYTLEGCIGIGGHGAVWRARDRVTGDAVALKLIESGFAGVARVRREVAALRLLRVPGVVRLLDEGHEGNTSFLAMELVEGRPFPGAAPPRQWSDVVTPTLSLLEVLARIHATGVVHRDLKPGNVLVDREGRATVLDFGIAWGSLDLGITAQGEILGTPHYLAPEQVNDGPIGPRADLFALGAMLYEALSGRPPHQGDNFFALIYARMNHPITPLRMLCPHVPPVVADVVEALLARSPDDRPRSAGEVLAMLKGRSSQRPPALVSPRFVDHDAVDRLVAAARAGTSLDIAGPPRSGRTRCLEAATVQLRAEGRRVLWTHTGSHPFKSLEDILETADDSAATALAAMTAGVEKRVRALLRDGVVIVADDVEQTDRWSIAVLSECRREGTVLRALDARRVSSTDTVRVRPLGHAALKKLFAGPDRILHLADDAATALLSRTEGWPPCVEDELDAWVRAGLTRNEEGVFVITREALDRLDVGLRIAPLVRRPGSMSASEEARSDLSPFVRNLAAWLAFAWPHTDPQTLSAATGQPLWQIEASLAELVEGGHARRRPDGRTEPASTMIAEPSWPADVRDRAHRALANVLSPGADGRLRHLLAASEGGNVTPAELATEAIALALRKDRDGLVGQGVAALEETLRLLRRADHPPADRSLQERVLAIWTDLALADGTTRGMDRVLYEIYRTVPRTAFLTRLEALVRAALAARVDGERALATTDALTAFDDPNLAWWRHGVRVQAARRCSLTREEEVVEEARQWASGVQDTSIEASLAGWLGRLRYRQLRFTEAAELHAQAIAGEQRLTRRVAAMTNAASALLDAHQLDAAESMAARALELSRECRHPYFEGRAEWVLRTVKYRRGEADTVDHELVAAAAAINHQELEAMICMTEAAVAWRLGQSDVAAKLSMGALQYWTASGWMWLAVLPRCFVLEHTKTIDPVEIYQLADRAIACRVPDIALQAMGLLVRLYPPARQRLREPAMALATTFERSSWGFRRDVLSIAEATALIQGDATGALYQLPVFYPDETVAGDQPGG